MPKAAKSRAAPDKKAGEEATLRRSVRGRSPGRACHREHRARRSAAAGVRSRSPQQTLEVPKECITVEDKPIRLSFIEHCRHHSLPGQDCSHRQKMRPPSSVVESQKHRDNNRCCTVCVSRWSRRETHCQRHLEFPRCVRYLRIQSSADQRECSDAPLARSIVN